MYVLPGSFMENMFNSLSANGELFSNLLMGHALIMKREDFKSLFCGQYSPIGAMETLISSISFWGIPSKIA